jgi:hypothetical protein
MKRMLVVLMVCALFASNAFCDDAGSRSSGELISADDMQEAKRVMSKMCDHLAVVMATECANNRERAMGSVAKEMQNYVLSEEGNPDYSEFTGVAIAFCQVKLYDGISCETADVAAQCRKNLELQ